MIPAAPGPVAPADQDAVALPFLADMYGLQLDQLTELLGVTGRQSRALVARWVSRKLAESGTAIVMRRRWTAWSTGAPRLRALLTASERTAAGTSASGN